MLSPMTKPLNIVQPSRLDFVAENGAPYLQYTEFNTSPRNRMKLACVVRALEESGLPRDSRILEVGCGMGNVAIPLASLGYHMTATDIHEPSIEECRKRNPFNNIEFLAQDAQTMDLREFDAVIMSDVLEHIPHCDEFLRRLVSTMKGGSWFVLTVPNGWNVSELALRPSYWIKPTATGKRIVSLVKRLLRTRDTTTANEETPHVNFFTLNQLEHLFAENGMKAKRMYAFFSWWTLWETLFSERKVPAIWPEQNFRRSMDMHPRRCAEWAFLLRKTGTAMGAH